MANVGFNKILENFQAHLDELGKTNPEYKDANAKNIYKYSNEFSEFLRKSNEAKLIDNKINVGDLAVDEANDILQEDFLDVTKTNSKVDQDNILFNMIETMIENDDEFKAQVAGEDGVVSSNEFDALIKAVKANDDNEDDLSFKDIMDAVDDMKDGKFELGEVEPMDAEVDAEGDGNNTGGDDGGNNNNNNNNDNNNNNNDNDNDKNDTPPTTPNDGDTPTPTVSSYAGLSVDELEAEKAKNEGFLAIAQADYDAVQNGTSPRVSAYKDAMNASEEAYNALVDEENEYVKKVADQTTVVDDARTELEDTTQSLSEQTQVHEGLVKQVASAETALASTEASIASVDSAISTAQNAKDKDGKPKVDFAKLAGLQSQKENLETLKQQQQEELDELKEKEIEAKAEVDRLTELQKLQTETLEREEKELAEFEAELADNISPEAKKAYDQFQKDKGIYEAQVSQELATLADDIAGFTALIQDIENQIIIVEAQEAHDDAMNLDDDYEMP